MDEVTAAVIAAAEESAGGQSQTQQRPGEVRLSTGVTVRVKAMSRDVYDDITARIKRPEVPVWTNPDKGRTEENPSDPAYLQALADYHRGRMRALKLAIYSFGLEVLDVPAGFPGPDAPDWLEELRLSGMASGDSAAARRLDWLRYKAITADEDVGHLIEEAGRRAGVLEVDVLEAMKSV